MDTRMGVFEYALAFLDVERKPHPSSFLEPSGPMGKAVKIGVAFSWGLPLPHWAALEPTQCPFPV